MKTQYRNMLWLAALPLVFAMGACQNEELAESGQSVNIEGKTVLRATMGSYNASQSRAQVVLGNEDEAQEVFMWNEEDAFMVYNQEEPSVSSLFTISGYDEWNTPSAEATFISEGEISEGTKVTAIYPAPDTSAVKDGVVTLAFADPNGTSVGDNSERRIQEYMKTHMLMYATATMEGANTNLTFQHLCAMARVSYTNATRIDQKITEVTVGTGTNCMNHSMTFNLKDNTYEVNKNSASVSLTFNDLTVASGRTVDFYLLFIPSGNLLGNADTVKVSINDYKVGMPASEIASQKFEAGKRYWFKVMQTQADGLIWKKNVAEGMITNLELIAAVEEQNNISFTKDENGFVDVEANQEIIQKVTTLNFSNRNVDNTDWLKYFTELKELRLNNVGLRSLDLSHNVKLETLLCYSNYLTELDLTNNKSLTFVSCFSNELKSLDVSQNLELESLYLTNNPLQALDVKNNTKLVSLDFSGTVSYIDLSNNLNLKDLDCSDSDLSILDVSMLSKLEFLWCDDTNISSLDVSHNTALKELRCGNKKLTSLDVSKNIALEILAISQSLIASIDLTNNTELHGLYCSECQLKELDITKNQKLEFVDSQGTVMFLCGNQCDAEGNPIEITLYLTSNQATLWETVKDDYANQMVILKVQE